ncbi:MAG: FAD-dependent oxidoreductase [Pseudomonadota bacterium]
MAEKIVIVGGGQAGLQLTDSLRRGGFSGELMLVSEEESLPYHRPPLSKGFLTGDIPQAKLLFRPQEYYAKREIHVLLDHRVSSIDLAGQFLQLSSGDTLEYDALALATGARVRELPLNGADASNVHYLRSLSDTLRIQTQLAEAKRVVVIGGGFIGLEVAASATKMGKEVTCLEGADRLLGRVVSPFISDFYLSAHQSRGMKIVLNAKVDEFSQTNGQVDSVVCADGSQYAADLVVIGIGVIPNQELAESAGIVCDNGIVVDEFARTSATNVVATGDCTNHLNPYAQNRIRLESVQNAIDQSKTAASTLLGTLEPYNAVPWFWSDQFDLKLQIAGLSTGANHEVLRGRVDQDKFSLFYFRDEKLLAVDSVNSPADHMIGRKLLSGNCQLSPQQAADVDFDLKTLLK